MPTTRRLDTYLAWQAEMTGRPLSTEEIARYRNTLRGKAAELCDALEDLWLVYRDALPNPWRR